jgi:hypothetical protein
MMVVTPVGPWYRCDAETSVLSCGLSSCLLTQSENADHNAECGA